ncbi:MAG: hypothetical protein QY323_05710 [Patescibacteria group bacterium]|nr:MAG: hypothetical protein QY323_05710 [Patescibacteria group bacterium]
MLEIWKHFLANRRKGALPALIGLAIVTFFASLPLVLATPLPPALSIGISFAIWAYVWLFALPAAIYMMDHRPKTPRVPRHMLN